MDETEKRIIGYGLAGNIGGGMAIVALLGGLGIIPPLAMMIIEIISAPNLMMAYAWIRYKFKIKGPIPNMPEIPEIPIEPEPTE